MSELQNTSINPSSRAAYDQAGVNVEAGYEAVRLMTESVKRTRIPGVLSDTAVKGFGAAFSMNDCLNGISKNWQDPVLVSGTDGVGTKLKLAFLMGCHNTVGIDCVAMCVNDVLCCGARPLFFLDYIAVGKNIPERVAAIVSGVAEGCVQAGCALIGGETAEMPGFYAPDEYDLAGFSVGAVEREKMLEPQGSKSKVKAGDILIALPSSGLHSNGFSLVRRVFNVENPNAKLKLDQTIPELGRTLGEELLTPTRIYVKPVLALMDQIDIHSLAHITGGGFFENIPRSIAPGLAVCIERSSLTVPPVFELVMREGEISLEQMYHIFNMGVGMTVTVAPDDADQAVRVLKENHINARIIGSVVNADDVNGKLEGEGGVFFC